MFIDDERFPPNDNHQWYIARNMDEVLQKVRIDGIPHFISFDHDLGDNTPDGCQICHKLIEMDLDGVAEFPADFDYYVHSQNPTGRDNIDGLLKSFLKFKSA